MPAPSQRRVFLKICLHTGAGAAVGMVLALSLLVQGAEDIRDMILASASPMSTMAVFLGAITSVFAVGSGLTGLIFVLMEES